MEDDEVGANVDDVGVKDDEVGANDDGVVENDDVGANDDGVGANDGVGTNDDCDCIGIDAICEFAGGNADEDGNEAGDVVFQPLLW